MAAIADAVEAAAEGWALEAAGAAELAAILRADEAPPPAGWADVAAALRALRTLGAVNAAFIFVKPHAHTEGVKAMVKEKLGARGVTIVEEGTLDADAIDSRKLIDQHYYAIASKATLLKPEKLPVPAMEFEKFFGRAWREALKDGRVFNALEACAKLEVDVAGLDALWRAAEAAGKLVKFGGGFYCAKLEPKGKQFAYVFNGFFMAMRAKYVAPGSAISYYSVEWDPAELSWADFRALVLGPTDPAQAPPASIRGAILAEWEALGLAAAPNVGDNGVHASASPFEGMAERMNWLGAKLDDRRLRRRAAPRRRAQGVGAGGDARPARAARGRHQGGEGLALRRARGPRRERVHRQGERARQAGVESVVSGEGMRLYLQL